jgi:hypothetical protein
MEGWLRSMSHVIDTDLFNQKTARDCLQVEFAKHELLWHDMPWHFGQLVAGCCPYD